ncbi:Uncharacterized protein dnm_041810 [Desulfonema magnum]|uniref:Uncharacterized protein n=1 Tax=Desulfonema magnum TaxID=45655 RepID=A0A975BMB3_9BACT|nr:Uncharacterized protein dnm_041810 [Desulfonema magnum]
MHFTGFFLYPMQKTASLYFCTPEKILVLLRVGFYPTDLNFSKMSG